MLHRNIQVQYMGETGMGLVAVDAIQAGEVVWQELETETVEVFSSSQLQQLPPEKARLAYWDRVRNAYVITVDSDANFMNHSCDPNLGWAGEYTLVAMRDIAAGEEVTYDYATSDIVGINGQTELICLCGSSFCRTVIKPTDLLVYPELRQRYKGFLPPSVVDWMVSELKLR